MNMKKLLFLFAVSSLFAGCGGGGTSTTSTPTPVATGCAGSVAIVRIAFSPSTYTIKVNQRANIAPSTLEPYDCIKQMSFTSGLPLPTSVLNISPPAGLAIVDGSFVGIPTKTGSFDIAVGITGVTGYSLSKTVYSNTIRIIVIP
jgi:hypothetical protein